MDAIMSPEKGLINKNKNKIENIQEIESENSKDENKQSNI